MSRMRAVGELRVRISRRLAWSVSWGASIRCIVVLHILAGLGPAHVLADGCFVFKWNRNIDINEPTQKAIICFDAGHEQILLQVKYEGPLEEFGWLIPTPSLPKVEQGRMEPFYELSQLTQKRFGTPYGRGTKGATLGGLDLAGGEEERVRVVEIKTVGAYEVSVLSAQDAGSLKRWLDAHDYSFPEGKSEIVEEYTRLGWYFVAAKIQLNTGRGFRNVSATSPTGPHGTAKARKQLQSKLSSGELHPLLISFDTPQAVFPLKISAVNGKTSEVSLYILATTPLLSTLIFAKAADKQGQEYAKWDGEKRARAEQMQRSRVQSRAMGLGFFLDSFYTTNRGDRIPAHLRDYTGDDLIALAREEVGPMPTDGLGQIFYGQRNDLLQCMAVSARDLPQCGKAFSGFRAGEWFLTKQVQTFTASQMQDLEFEPAIRALAQMLSRPEGSVAAQILAEFEPGTHAELVRACQSTNSIERLNGVIGIELSRKSEFGNVLAGFLKDETPAVRLHALRAAEAHPEPQFVDTVVGLLRDPEPEVRQGACGYLSAHERPDRTPFYLALMRDPDPNVRAYSLYIAGWINRYATSDDVFREALRLLKDPNEDVRAAALHTLYRMHDKEVPREDLLPFLSSPVSIVSATAHSMLRPGPPGSSDRRATLSSAETAGLITNSVATARLAGLKNLQEKGDAQAVELILPLLTDTNKLVRNRAFFVLRNITGEDVSKNDPSKWQAWWEANKSLFKPAQRRSAPSTR